MLYKYAEKVLRPGTAWTDDDGIQHPGNWDSWPEQELTEHGITVVQEGVKKDDRFYYNTVDMDGTVTSTPKDLDMLKAAYIRTTKDTCRSYILNEVPEWKQANLTARAVELVKNGTLIGPEVDAIQAVWDRVKELRAHSDSIEAQITACTTIAELEQLFVTPQGGVAPIDDWTAVVTATVA